MHNILTIISLTLCHTYAQEIHYQKIIQNIARLPNQDKIQEFKQSLQARGIYPQEESADIKTIFDLQTIVNERKFRKRTFSAEELDSIRQTLSNSSIISPVCVDHVITTFQSLNFTDNWATRVFDSFGKIESGIFEGNLKWYGSFDECLAVRGLEFNVTDPQEIFKGQYCLLVGMFSEKLLTIGLCVPDSCDDQDLNVMIYTTMAMLLPNQTVPMYGYCQPVELELNDKAIGATSLFSFIFLCIVIGTVFDILVIQMPKWNAYEENGDEKTSLLDKPKAVTQYTEPGVLSKILCSFSVYTNGKKLLNTDQPEGSLTAVNGIRFLSMSWVIIGHSYVFIENSTDNLNAEYPKLFKRWTFQGIVNALVSVDTFFTLSGLLVAYLFMKALKKSGGRMGAFQWFMFYFHRFWRLTPVYMLVLFGDIALSRYFADGPAWPAEFGFERDFCKDTWWTNPLYINNLVRSDKMCFGWSWYLANDMQFYVISPLLLMPLFFFPSIGMGVCFVFLLGTMIASGLTSSHYDLPPSMFSPGMTETQSNVYRDKYYIKPHTRFGPYVIGIIIGYLLYRTEKGFKMNKLVNLLGWAVATAVALAIIYGLHDHIGNGTKLSTELSAFYNAVHRSCWGACVGWVIFVCARGYGGYVNTILSWKGFIPLSRLTYCAYLVHPLVMYTVYLSNRSAIHMTDITMIYYIFGNMVGSFSVALVVSLGFESPMMGLEKAIVPNTKKQ